MLGELSYLVGRHLGQAHRGLGDNTPGVVRNLSTGAVKTTGSGRLEMFHRDGQPAEVRSATAGNGARRGR